VFTKHVFSATTSAKCIESCFKSFRALITVIASLKDPKYEDRVQRAITLSDSIMIEDDLIRVVFATMDTAAQPHPAPARSDDIRRHIKLVTRRLHALSNCTFKKPATFSFKPFVIQPYCCAEHEACIASLHQVHQRQLHPPLLRGQPCFCKAARTLVTTTSVL
jgi:hypothetical protein